MKTPKAGQLCTINNVVYRAKRRISGCHGCALDSLLTCPNCVSDPKNPTYNGRRLQCASNNIILMRV